MSAAVLEQPVLGSRRLSNFLVASAVTIGGVGFLLASLSSYLGRDLLPLGHPAALVFVPQGLVMGLYSLAAALLQQRRSQAVQAHHQSLGHEHQRSGVPQGEQVATEVARERSQKEAHAPNRDGRSHQKIRETTGAEHGLLEHCCGHDPARTKRHCDRRKAPTTK